MERINKTKARKLYEEGREITLTPCKANPKALWFHGVAIQKDAPCFEGRSFDSLVDEFEHYNCNYNELGRYAAYYTE